MIIVRENYRESFLIEDYGVFCGVYYYDFKEFDVFLINLVVDF